jgi:hypothetical protein
VVGSDRGGYIRGRTACQFEYEELPFGLALGKNQVSSPLEPEEESEMHGWWEWFEQSPRARAGHTALRWR